MGKDHTGAQLFATLAFAALTAGCGSGTWGGASAPSTPLASSSARPPSTSSSSAGSSSSASGSSVSGSAPSGGSTSASPGTRATSSGGSTRLCLAGTVTVLYPASDNPLRSSCVHVGTRIQITLRPLRTYQWAPVTSSAPSLVTVLGNQIASNGTRIATARADSPGTATLNSADTYTPDPHGPPSHPWQLTLTVVP
ncbi:hypothetical protein [Streptomyces mirabilis]|uniref:hypothetical protein n=1 Tax=Streptomyces mirabilis TaxID=68239 RepID=UPI0035DC2DE3